MAVELRCERSHWRAFAPLGTTKEAAAPGSRRPVSTSTAVLVALLVFPPLSLGFAMLVREISIDPDLSFAQFLVPLAAVVGLAALALTIHAWGTAWWHNGAGHPVLQVRDGVVRGRLDAASRREPAFDGWDFAVPLAQVRDAHITEFGHLALCLPDDLSEEVRARERTTARARRWTALTGTPAVWPASRMLRRNDRQQRLDALVAALTPESTTP